MRKVELSALHVETWKRVNKSTCVHAALSTRPGRFPMACGGASASRFPLSRVRARNHSLATVPRKRRTSQPETAAFDRLADKSLAPIICPSSGVHLTLPAYCRRVLPTSAARATWTWQASGFVRACCASLVTSFPLRRAPSQRQPGERGADRAQDEGRPRRLRPTVAWRNHCWHHGPSC